MSDEPAAGDRDLAIRKLELDRYKATLDYRKFVLASVFAAIVIAAIPPLFQLATAFLEYVKSEAQLKVDQENKKAERLIEEEKFRETYLKEFISQALNQDIELRIRLAEYFSAVSADAYRQGWADYLKDLKEHRTALRNDIDRMEREWKRGSSQRDGGEVEELERHLDWSYAELGYVAKNRSVAANPRAPTSSGRQIPLKDEAGCAKLAASDFKGRALPAAERDYQEISASLGVDLAVLKTVIAVQTVGTAFADGRPKILFERQVFHRLTGGQFSEANPDLSAAAPGGYGSAGYHQYERLKQAMILDCGAALASTSWGMFQILGSLAQKVGFQYVDEFVAAQMDSERAQLETAGNYLKSGPSLDALRQKDWAKFSRLFNGPSNADEYARRMAEKYASLAHP
jgi:hypothetical protein